MAPEYKDYYAILGVAKTASADELKRAYRRLAKEHHPDLQPEKSKAQSAEKFKEVNEAYEVLSDPAKKAKYDELGPGWQAPQGSGGGAEGFDAGDFEGSVSGFSDFFETLFGREGGGVGLGGQDVEAELPLTLEEAIRGGEKKLTLALSEPCPTCGGTGRRGRALCPTCRGAGQVRRERTITAQLPKHVQDGTKLRLRGQGNAGPTGRGRGDLFLRVRLLPHPQFKVSGSDLETVVTVMPWVAALGGEAEVASLEGSVRVKIPAGSHAGRALRISGKGLGREGGSRGDLYAVIRIDIPEKIDSRLERLFQEMKSDVR